MSSLINLRKQLTFYGAYHSNETNVMIHIICVPLIQWSAQVLLTLIAPKVSWFPAIHYQFGNYLEFDFNWAAVQALVWTSYFMLLEPTATLLYLPQQTLSLLTAIAYAHRASNAMPVASLVQAVTWIVQFIGHGVFEGRAPALLDNIVGALVLAPFFVHLENLFWLGWNPQLHKDVQNSIGVEVARIRKLAGDKRRARAEAKRAKQE